MRSTAMILSAILLFSCAKPGHKRVTSGTAITGWDGITIIKAFQEKYSNQVEVHIMMRPEMKNNIYVLWQIVDTDHKIRQYKSVLREGRQVDISIGVTPGSQITGIQITGYEKLDA